MTLFLHPINWAENPKIRRVWKITKEESLSTKQQTYQILPKSFFEIKYTILTTQFLESERLQRLITNLKSDTVKIPLWVDFLELTSPIVAGDTTLLTTSTLGARFESKELLIVSSSGTLTEIRNHYDVFSDSISLVDPTINNFEIGSKIYPLLSGYFPKKPELSWITDQHLSAEVAFREATI